MEHLGWRNRGYLPHCDAADLIQHIVFGLADAGGDEVDAPGLEAAFDAGLGGCLLRQPEFADVMQTVLLHGDGARYRLLAWCVMPSHVHAVIQQLPNSRLSDVVQAWKSTAAHRINALARRKGALWRREYFDRFMRDDGQLATTIAYVENNPVAAKLVARAEDWLWSSARLRTASVLAGEGA